MYNISFHTHTRYSDGHMTILESAIAHKKAGFQTLVITDHYYGRLDLSAYSLTLESFVEAQKEAIEVSKEVGIPIIVGAEMNYNRMEEINVFGIDAIKYLMDTDMNHSDYQTVRRNYKCAMQLNHPNLRESLNAKVYEVLDAYERYNSGQDFFSRKDIPIEFKYLTPLCNSDAHGINSISRGYNKLDWHIKNTEDLIYFMETGKGLLQYSVRDIDKEIK